ncbi:MAG: amidohydrolase [Alphaproteobacteria bacterium]|nr:amidohydrolase [Alphaproteobacteria bacterium]
MSAYLVSPEHITNLAAWATQPQRRAYFYNIAKQRPIEADNRRQVTHMLAAANLASVAARYGSDDSMCQPEAVLTKGETIFAVGTEADLRSRMPENTKDADLKGRCLIPAFIDPHGHFPDTGFVELFRIDLSSPPRGDCLDMGSALHRLSQKAKITKKGEWIMGVLFDNLNISEGRMPTMTELDQVSTDHPIWVLHASGHNGVANSYVFNLLGITQQTSDPFGGRYNRDPETGELTGVIEGLEAMQDMGQTDFLIDNDKFWRGFKTARDEYVSHGVTMAQNAWVSRSFLEYFATLPAGKDPGIDVILLPVGEEEPAMTNGDDAVEWQDNPYFKIGPRKLFTDGAFQLQTAYLSKPYHIVLNADMPRGAPYVEWDIHKRDVIRLHRLGFQIHCHCNGDAGADMFIDAVENALKDCPLKDHRHTIIHGQTLREDQLDKIARLGMSVSFFSAHIYYWGDLHYATILGPERAERISPAASAQQRGIRFTIHNDASVTPTRPLHLAHCAVERQTHRGKILGEEQKISRLSALRAMTIDAAWQVFEDTKRGSIENGKLADMVILSENPLETSTSLSDIRVIQTIRRGTIAYQA